MRVLITGTEHNVMNVVQENSFRKSSGIIDIVILNDDDEIPQEEAEESFELETLKTEFEDLTAVLNQTKEENEQLKARIEELESESEKQDVVTQVGEQDVEAKSTKDKAK